MSNTAITSFGEQRSAAVRAKPAQDVPGNQGKAVEKAKGGQRDVVANAKQELNTQILEASAKVSLQAGNESQALVFRAAIDRINELLAPDLGPDAIESKMAEDNSPEATAARILSLSTGFYDAYAAKHPESTPDEQAKNFVDLIRGGFEKGFKDATDILDGLKVFDGDIKSGIMKTYELVSKGYDDFLAGKLQKVSDTTEAGAAAG